MAIHSFDVQVPSTLPRGRRKEKVLEIFYVLYLSGRFPMSFLVVVNNGTGMLVSRLFFNLQTHSDFVRIYFPGAFYIDSSIQINAWI